MPIGPSTSAATSERAKAPSCETSARRRTSASAIATPRRPREMVVARAGRCELASGDRLPERRHARWRGRDRSQVLQRPRDLRAGQPDATLPALRVHRDESGFGERRHMGARGRRRDTSVLCRARARSDGGQRGTMGDSRRIPGTGADVRGRSRVRGACPAEHLLDAAASPNGIANRQGTLVRPRTKRARYHGSE